MNTGRIFDLAETKIVRQASSWTARLFKKAWLSNKNSLNKCIELPQAYSALRAAIEYLSMISKYSKVSNDDRLRRNQRNIFENFFVKTYHLF